MLGSGVGYSDTPQFTYVLLTVLFTLISIELNYFLFFFYLDIFLTNMKVLICSEH